MVAIGDNSSECEVAVADHLMGRQVHVLAGPRAEIGTLGVVLWGLFNGVEAG